MTCIVGLVKEGKVYMGGDTAGLDACSLHIHNRKDIKVFKLNNPWGNDFVVGYTSSFRMGQLLRFNFLPPHCPSDKDVYKYMCTDFIETVRRLFKDRGYAKIDSGVESGGTFLVGFRGQLFYIEDDFQVGEVMDDYNAVGCGYPFALGALHATETMDIPPKDRLEIALKAAQKFSGGVREPFTFEELESGEWSWKSN